MINREISAEEILNTAVAGYHQYDLDPPFRMSFAGDNLCRMLGFSREQMNSSKSDFYMDLVCAEDRGKYREFLAALSKREMELNLDYRLTKMDGSIIYVKDTMVSRALSGGGMRGYSTLSVTGPGRAGDMGVFGENPPFGFLKCTCEKQPRITYINEKMKEILRFPKDSGAEEDYLELYKSNIYMMIPMAAHRSFGKFLSRAYAQSSPIAGDLTVLRCDGTKAYLFGWITKVTDASGNEEFQSVCMDVSDKYRSRKESANKRYIRALSEVYDSIFEFNLMSNTISCLHGSRSPIHQWLESIPMQIPEAMEKWAISSVCEEDREAVMDFFRKALKDAEGEGEGRPPRISYRAASAFGDMESYSGTMLKIDRHVSLFCCRVAAGSAEMDNLRTEAEALRSINANMQQFVSRFAEGISGFEIKGDMVKPLYASDNICDFFGYSRDQWQSLMERWTPLDVFVAKGGASYENYADLLEKGEAEFIYHDFEKNEDRRIKAICSHKPESEEASRYVMLYNMDCRRDEQAGNCVSIRTFGYFGVFVGGKPIAFRTQKAKELFALLVDRRGGFVSSAEAIAFLWEDEPVNNVTLARYRKVALRLKNILEEHGIGDIMESASGKRRLVSEKVSCDLYEYLAGRAGAADGFKGSYMSNYSWAETTLGELKESSLRV